MEGTPGNIFRFPHLDIPCCIKSIKHYPVDASTHIEKANALVYFVCYEKMWKNLAVCEKCQIILCVNALMG